MSTLAARNTRRSAPNTGNAKTTSSTIDLDDAFANLDPALHAATLSAVSDSRELSPRAQSRLNDFAQHVVDDQNGGGGDQSHDDAASLLAFSAGDELFGGVGGSQPHQGFGELMEAAARRQENGDQSHTGFGELMEAAARTQEEQEQQRQSDERQQDGVNGKGENERDEQEVRDAVGSGEEATPGTGRRGKRRRKAGEEGEDGFGDSAETSRLKKDSHKEVERRRRENINDGINEIAKHIPGGLEKMGKGAFLRRAAEYLGEVTARSRIHDAELMKKEQEKADLQTELAMVKARLEEEQNERLQLATSLRESEDRVAQKEFELSALKMGQN